MGRNIRTQRLLTCLFSIRLFFDTEFVPFANRVSARRYNVLFLNRLQYSLGLIAASLPLPLVRLPVRSEADAELQTTAVNTNKAATIPQMTQVGLEGLAASILMLGRSYTLWR